LGISDASKAGAGAPVMVFSETGLWVVAHPMKTRATLNKPIDSRQGFFMSSSYSGCDPVCLSRKFLKFLPKKGEI
jgi:hypothetical protein